MLFPPLPTDWILFGVVGLVALNRLFESSRLSGYRGVYVVVQAVDLAVVALLFAVRMEDFQGRVELVVRLFLMLFLTFHMVRNSQVRTKALRDRLEEERELEERARLRAALAAQTAGEVEVLSGEESPEWPAK